MITPEGQIFCEAAALISLLAAQYASISISRIHKESPFPTARVGLSVLQEEARLSLLSAVPDRSSKCGCLLCARLWRGNRSTAFLASNSCIAYLSPGHRQERKERPWITRDLKTWASFIPVTDGTKGSSLVCLSDPRLCSRTNTIRKKNCSSLLLWSHLIREVIVVAVSDAPRRSWCCKAHWPSRGFRQIWILENHFPGLLWTFNKMNWTVLLMNMQLRFGNVNQLAKHLPNQVSYPNVMSD